MLITVITNSRLSKKSYFLQRHIPVIEIGKTQEVDSEMECTPPQNGQGYRKRFPEVDKYDTR